jgi:beta-fructofuranosidase
MSETEKQDDGYLLQMRDADEWGLNYHLMHPGADSCPGDPNAAFCLDGVYHLHYIISHPFGDSGSFSFVHVTSTDMLHWTWQPTKLQPSFTGHGMFSGTGFLTREGKPAVIYHGQASGRNQIAIARDGQLSAWEKPYPLDVRNPDGTAAEIAHWDPDCFLIGDTYYAISGGGIPPLMKSKDLRRWTLVGNFMSHDMPDAVLGEDISCANFFRLGDKWMLLCISHPLGCRYYIGDWDAAGERFVPQKHGRMNWRREDQGLFGVFQRTDFFAPESVLTPDGRRVMWAWCTRVNEPAGGVNLKTLQSLPRELSLPSDGVLRIKPLRELESLRYDPVVMRDIVISEVTSCVRAQGASPRTKVADLPGDAVELRITVARDQADRKIFGVVLFGDEGDGGLPVIVRPDSGTLRVGDSDAPFAVADLPPGEDLDLRIFIDKYIVEVFANDRQAVFASFKNGHTKPGLYAFSVGSPTTLKRLDLWRLKPTNQGFLEARRSRIWEPAAQ